MLTVSNGGGTRPAFLHYRAPVALTCRMFLHPAAPLIVRRHEGVVRVTPTAQQTLVNLERTVQENLMKRKARGC